jgi:hypothetical protein
MNDISPLLNPAVDYDPVTAMNVVRDVLIARIPGEPWRGDMSGILADVANPWQEIGKNIGNIAAMLLPCQGNKASA